MKHNRNPLAEAIRYGLGASVLASLAMTASPVVAQDDDEEDAETLDRVQVTGSRIISPIVTSSAPVTEIGEEEIQFTGTTRIEDLVGQYPQAAAVSDAFTVNPTAGFPTVSLRGLGANRTLTLVNGHRLPPGGIRSQARDLNQIPAALVKNVEILTGGASAVYGSDAMAGVVNFILDTDFTGFSIQAGWNAYQHDNSNSYMQGLQDARGFEYDSGDSGFDGQSKFVDISMGGFFDGGRGHAMAWVTYRDNDEMLQGERDYSSCALNGSGTACGGSATAPDPNFLVFEVDRDLNFIRSPVPGGTAHIDSNGVWQPGFDAVYNYAPINHYQRPDKRWTFGSSIRYDVNDRFRPYMETMFANTNGAVQIAQSGTFAVNQLNFDCSDPLITTLCSDLGVNPDNLAQVYVLKRNIEGGPRTANLEASNFRVVTGFEGDINESWTYDVSYLHARNSSSEANQNDFIPSRLAEALLLCPPGSSATCQPYNVWTPTSDVSPAQAAAQGGTGTRVGKTQLQVFNAFVSGDTGFALPTADGVPISLVGGYEWRKDRFQVISDANMESGNFAGLGGPRPSIDGEFSVNEFFAEAAVPVLADAGIIDSFALDLGFRYSDYSTSGGVETYKIGFASQILNDYRVRGGYNRAIRAANVGELFSQQQIALWGGADPCAGPNPTASAAACALTGVSADQYGSVPDNPASQYNQFIGGNPDLDPEVADTWTLGVVATPIAGLQVAVDYWNIAIEDRIGTIGASTILNQCLQGNTALCGNVQRGGSGDLWIGSDPNSSGLIVNSSQNFGEFNFSGVDLNVAYSFEAFGGTISTSLAGAYFLEQEVVPLPGSDNDAAYDCAGRINDTDGCQTPNWQHVANVRYSTGDWTVSARWRMIGRMNYRDGNGDLTTDQILVGNGNRVGSYHFYDLSGSYNFLGNYSATVGVNNIFDKEPPLVGSTLALNGNSIGGYDQLGRYIFATIGADF